MSMFNLKPHDVEKIARDAFNTGYLRSVFVTIFVTAVLPRSPRWLADLLYGHGVLVSITATFGLLGIGYLISSRSVEPDALQTAAKLSDNTDNTE